MTDKRTMLGWFEYLDDTKREMTLSEFMAMMLFHIRQHDAKTSTLAQHQRDTLEHADATLGTFAELLAEIVPAYRAIEDRRTEQALARSTPPNGALRGGTR